MPTGTQPIRGGMRNMLANWQIIAISLLEVLVGSYVLSPVGGWMLQPLFQMLISTKVGAPAPSLASPLTTNWVLVVGGTVGFGLLLFVTLLCHAFVNAGIAFVYVAGEQKVLAEQEILANWVVSGSKAVLSMLVSEQRWNETFASLMELTQSAGEGAVAVISACWLLATMIALTEMHATLR